jgi:glyoxylase-like metal-dependent hydrolase (beta-lactamase superfamily II)
MDARITFIAPGVFGVEENCGDDIEVRALLVEGDKHTLLVDTLLRPSDLAGIKQRLAGREGRLLVANSHADWDHWWGNAAFPEAPIVAHRLTRERQLLEGERSLADMRAARDGFAEVTLRPATVAFEGVLVLDLGGIRAELSLLPGHTPDCIVVWVPERELLFAGDTAEDPVPLVTVGPIHGWPQALRAWARKAKIVVPAHGPVSGPELLVRNAQYLEGLLTDPSRSVPELEGAEEFYRNAHQRNLNRAAEEAGRAL